VPSVTLVEGRGRIRTVLVVRLVERVEERLHGPSIIFSSQELRAPAGRVVGVRGSGQEVA
jgi:hypothetical protein